jgi:hypothetical protein
VDRAGSRRPRAGEAFTCEARFLSGLDDRALVKRFQGLAEAAYRRLLGELRRRERPRRSRGSASASPRSR